MNWVVVGECVITFGEITIRGQLARREPVEVEVECDACCEGCADSGGGISSFAQFHDAIIAEIAAGLGIPRWLYDAPEARRRNIEIYERQNGKLAAEVWPMVTDDGVAALARMAVDDAETEARAENRKLTRAVQIEICERHYAPYFVTSWRVINDATLQGYADCALLEDWEQAHREDACRIRVKKILACVSYYSHSHEFFESMAPSTLQGWYSAIGPRKVGA
ncbi:hypothetical protein ABLT15_26790 [Paraburkholderia tropica]|uniref:hypothetical protein n=1 Tax=Paraburkholderia tropica TaxID=92647 RepID=UPI0032B384BA